MADLPTGTLYGTVVGQFIQAVADTADAGRDPDSLPMQGTITFTPGAARVLLPSATPNPLTMYQKSIVCTLDAEGYLLGPDGARGVKLVASDSPGNPTNFTYSVSVDLVGVAGFSFSFFLPAGETVDLTTATPAAPDSGALVPTDELIAAMIESAGTATQTAVANFTNTGVNTVTPGAEYSYDRSEFDGSGRQAVLWLTYFTARNTRTVSTVSVPGDNIAAGLTMCRFGLYSEDASGNLTLIASTPNTTSGLFTATYQMQHVAFSATANITAGNRYAVGILILGTTRPYISSKYVYELANTVGKPLVALAPSVTTDLVPSIAAGSLSRDIEQIAYVEVY
jgi:hypothetical protein